MAINRTEITVTSMDSSFSVPGDMSPQQIQANYATQLQGIGNMSYTDNVETRSDGEVRVVVFSPRTGTKG